MIKRSLPIDAALPQICGQLVNSQSLVVSAAPGAGKTTRLPPEILSLTDKQVWVLEPRRIAAVAAAGRIAEENNWTLGKEVGYQVRFDNKSSKETRLLFLTEALLMRKLLQDPELSQVGCVILDEFHERSLHVDLALGALKELQDLARLDLKIIVMSATLNTRALSSYLSDAPVAVVPGQSFQLQIRYEEKAQLLRTGPDFTERLRKLILKVISENAEGDVLCFLPGLGEIERLREALKVDPAKFMVLALHGRLSLQDQRVVLEPLSQSADGSGKRKIVLATNVAESSLTVEGVRLVVDSGLARLSQIDARTGFESLDLVRISKASATQRAGRAARQGPGIVYRAWTPHDELSMKDFEVAEIFRSDLSESLLLLAALGVTRFENFSWFESPSGKALSQARDFLMGLGALHEDGTLLDLGKQIRAIPLHPRLSKLLIEGRQLGHPHHAADLAALLSERDSRSSAGSQGEHENDIWARWETWKRSPHHPKSQLLARTAEQLRNLVGSSSSSSSSSSSKNLNSKQDQIQSSKQTSSRNKFEQSSELSLEQWMLEVLLSAYSDRLCRRRRPREPQAKMVGGRGVKLHPDSGVKTSEYFLAIELSEGRDAAETLIYQAVGIPTNLVEKRLTQKTKLVSRLEFEEEKNRFLMIEAKEWLGLTIGNENRRPAKPDEVADRLIDLVSNRWEQVLASNESFAQWLKRLEFLNKMNPDWPLFNETEVRQGLELSCYGEHSLEKVMQKDLVSFFEVLLTEEHRKALLRECPSHWVVPSGSRLCIQYSNEQGPMIEVRLQELFGLAKTPKIAGQNLTLVILAPNYRPVQVTRDLESFWQNAYPEVRKEMRSRYPKHSWPDDPLTAAAQAKGRPRQ